VCPIHVNTGPNRPPGSLSAPKPIRTCSRFREYTSKSIGPAESSSSPLKSEASVAEALFEDSETLLQLGCGRAPERLEIPSNIAKDGLSEVAKCLWQS
jgi:hypothetical protein